MKHDVETVEDFRILDAIETFYKLHLEDGWFGQRLSDIEAKIERLRVEITEVHENRAVADVKIFDVKRRRKELEAKAMAQKELTTAKVEEMSKAKRALLEKLKQIPNITSEQIATMLKSID